MKCLYSVILVLISCASFGTSPINTQSITVKEAKKLGFIIECSTESWATIYQVTPILQNKHKCKLFNVSSGFYDQNGNFSGQIFVRKSGIPSEIEIAVPPNSSKADLSFDYICENPSPRTSIRYTITF